MHGMRRLFALALLFCSACIAAAEPLSAQQQQAWSDHLLPLPQEFSVSQVVTRSAAPVFVSTLAPGEIAVNAAGMLARYCGGTTQTQQSGAFQITLGLLDAQGSLDGIPVSAAARFAELPNRAQAYAIQPAGENRLLVAAVDEKGLFYGAATLIQLLTSPLAQGATRIPLVEIVDWPDFEERGIWNNPDPDIWIEWLPALKLNHSNMWTNEIAPIKRGETGRFKISAEPWKRAHRMAFRYSPQILHLNFLHQHGLFIAYPELAGEGDSALAGRYLAHGAGNPHRAPKPDHPELIRLLRDWMLDIAAQGADEAIGWLSERPAADDSAETAAVGQFVLEARAFVAAWREVQKQHPDFQLRLFLSTTTEERDYRVYHETPPEVKIIRCCATPFERVTFLPRDRFVNNSLDPYAKAGRHVTSYDVPLPGYGKVENPIYMIPHSSPQRIRDFVTQLHDRGYSGAVGRCWDTCDVNMSALAEWGWNLDGRSETDLMRAWATRKGYADPAAVAAWSGIMGPIEWDLYDSDFPECYSHGHVMEMIQNRTRPYLGEGIFRYFTDPQAFDAKLEAAQRALAISERFEQPEFADETRVAISYIKLSKAIWQVADLLATDRLHTTQSQTLMQSHLATLSAACDENASAIRGWYDRHVAAAAQHEARNLDPFLTGGMKLWKWEEKMQAAVDNAQQLKKSIGDWVSGRYLYLIKE